MVNGAQNEAGKFKPNLEVMLPTPQTGLVPGLVGRGGGMAVGGCLAPRDLELS